LNQIIVLTAFEGFEAIYVKPKDALRSGAPPRIPLGKLAALPQTPLVK